MFIRLQGFTLKWSLKGTLTDRFYVRFFRSNNYSHLENMNAPKTIRPQYHLRGPMALFRCSSYCKHAPSTVNAAPPIVNVFRRGAAFTVGGAQFPVGGALFTVGGAYLQ